MELQLDDPGYLRTRELINSHLIMMDRLTFWRMLILVRPYLKNPNLKKILSKHDLLFKSSSSEANAVIADIRKRVASVSFEFMLMTSFFLIALSIPRILAKMVTESGKRLMPTFGTFESSLDSIAKRVSHASPGIVEDIAMQFNS